jgi:hypothetical protein
MNRKVFNEHGELVRVNNIFKMIGIDLYDISKNRSWTPDGSDYLIDLYKLGWTADEMAEEMNRTPGSIVGKIYDLGEEGKITPEMWGVDNRDNQFPKGPLGNIAIYGKEK